MRRSRFLFLDPARHAQDVAEAALMLVNLHEIVIRPCHRNREAARDLAEFQRMYADIGGATRAQLRAAIDEESMTWHPGWRTVDDPEGAIESFRLAACQLLGRVLYRREALAIAANDPELDADSSPYVRVRALDALRRQYGPAIVNRWMP